MTDRAAIRLTALVGIAMLAVPVTINIKLSQLGQRVQTLTTNITKR